MCDVVGVFYYVVVCGVEVYFFVFVWVGFGFGDGVGEDVFYVF